MSSGCGHTRGLRSRFDMPVGSQRQRKVAYTVITLLGLAYAFYRGFLFPLPARLSAFDHWQVGDWLIDYSGGVVRRGLSGQVFFFFAPDGQSAIALVVITQLVLAAALFGLIAVLYMRTDRGPAWMMLVLSPAFVLFYALDITGNTRKELIVLVALAVAAVATRLGRSQVGLWLALPIFAIGVLSHEAFVVTLPAFAYLAFTSLSAERARIITGAYALPAIVALTVAVFRPGDSGLAGRICESWGQRGIDDCGGALAAIGIPASDMINALFTESFPGHWVYLLPAALAALPFFALRFFPAQRLIGVITVAAVAPLFFIGWDYGRWIVLIVAQLSLLALARPQVSRPMRVPLYAAAAFILLWGFNHASPALNDGLGIRWLASIFS